MRARWTELMGIINRISPVDDEPPTALALVMDKTRREHFGSNRTMVGLMKVRAGSYATDPRDYFFSLMGLVSEEDRIRSYLPVDYSRPAEDIFSAAAVYLLDTFGLKGFFRTHVEFSSSSTSTSSLWASLLRWVPDWSLRTPWVPVKTEIDKKTSLDSPPSPVSTDNMVLYGRLVLAAVEMISHEEPGWGNFEQISSILPLESEFPSLSPLNRGQDGLIDPAMLTPESYYLWRGWIHPLLANMVDDMPADNDDSWNCAPRRAWISHADSPRNCELVEWCMMHIKSAKSGNGPRYRLARIRDKPYIHLVTANAAVGDVIFNTIGLANPTEQNVSWDGWGLYIYYKDMPYS